MIIQVQNLRFNYGKRVALQGISFEVNPGEIFGLLGPNGGGKSTTFRILSTFLKPYSGTVTMFGMDAPRNHFPIRERIGVVFQSASLDRKLSVRENLVHQGHLYNLKGKQLQERIDELLERFGLKDRSSERVEVLSGGLRRRVEIAKGVLHKPDLLLLDEPSTGLDPAVRMDLWKYLEELRSNDGVTVLLTTHFLEEAEKCDRIAILDRGAIVTTGTPEELKREIGGEVVTIRSQTTDQLRDLLKEQFGGEPKTVNGVVRIEVPHGHEWIPKLIQAFPGQIDSITVGKPTLEDVFIQRTGHPLEND